MTTAKIFQHGGGQALRLPKAFRFGGAEVLIERRGGEVIPKPPAGGEVSTAASTPRWSPRTPESSDGLKT